MIDQVGRAGTIGGIAVGLASGSGRSSAAGMVGLRVSQLKGIIGLQSQSLEI